MSAASDMTPFERLDDAIHHVRGYVALLDVMKDHLERNAASTQLGFPVAGLPTDYVCHMLTRAQGFALDFLLNKVGQASDELEGAWDAIDVTKVSQ